MIERNCFFKLVLIAGCVTLLKLLNQLIHKLHQKDDDDDDDDDELTDDGNIFNWLGMRNTSNITFFYMKIYIFPFDLCHGCWEIYIYIFFLPYFKL